MKTKLDLTARQLLVLMSSLKELDEAHERVRVQLLALAKRHGVAPVPKDHAVA